MRKLLIKIKEYNIPHELHPITSAKEFEGALKAFPTGSRAEPWKL